MKRLQPQNREELEQAVAEAAEVLERGGLIIYPTDTIYGVGVDGSNTAAVRKVFDLKNRGKEQSLPVVVADIHLIEKYGEMTPLAQKIAERMLPGPIMLLIEDKGVLSPELTLKSELLGVRVPDSFFCLALAQTFGKPYTSTSANKSGMSAGSIDEILEQLEDKVDLVDLVIDVGPLDEKLPSTILDVSTDAIRIVREGTINFQAVNMVTLAEEGKRK